MPEPSVSRGEIAVFIKRAGFTLTPAEIDEYYEAYRYIEDMAAMIRTPMSYMSEPAHIFSFPEENRK